MLRKEEIHEQRNKKIENYKENYARRNKLTLRQDRSKFYTELHNFFVEDVPTEIHIVLECFS